MIAFGFCFTLYYAVPMSPHAMLYALCSFKKEVSAPSLIFKGSLRKDCGLPASWVLRYHTLTAPQNV